MRKASSYDFVGTGESLGTGPNSQSIKSNLMPATVPPPRKPTPEELKAQIKNLNKRVKRYEQKHQRHHNFFVTKLRMKDESVLKLNRLLACKKEQVVDLSNKLKVNHLFYVTLHCTKVDSNPMDISTRLLNKLKEEKRSHRVTLGLLTSIKKRADDATYEIRGLQSDLIAVKECANQTLEEAKEEYQKELSELNHKNKRAVQAGRRAAMTKSKAKLEKAKDVHRMAQQNLQKILDQYKAESKQHYLDSIKSLKSLEKSVRAKLDLIEQEHISELNQVKHASRLNLQDQVSQFFYVTLHCTKFDFYQHARSIAKIADLKAKVEELKLINLELKHEATEERRARRKAEKDVDKVAMLAARRLKKMQLAQEEAKRTMAENDVLHVQIDELATESDELRQQVLDQSKLLEDYELVIKECAKIKDSDGRGGLRWPRWMVLLILEFLANGTAPSAIPDNIRSAYWTLYDKGSKELPSEDFCRKCRTVADRFNECLVAILIAQKKWKTIHTDGTSRRQTSFETMILGLEGKTGEMLQNIIVSSCIFMETEDAEGCVAGIERKVSHIYHDFHNDTTHTYYVA